MLKGIDIEEVGDEELQNPQHEFMVPVNKLKHLTMDRQQLRI